MFVKTGDGGPVTFNGTLTSGLTLQGEGAGLVTSSLVIPRGNYDIEGSALA